MTPSERHALMVHAAYAVASAVVLLAPLATPQAVLVLVVLYNVALPAAALAWGHRDWLRLWLFLVPLSALQVFPDWFLAGELGVLVFPHGPHVGPVSAFMAGMWTIPLWIVVFTGWSVAARAPRAAALAWVALASFGLFVGSEATLTRLPVWYARNVARVDQVALYVVVPEVLLGLATYLAFEAVERRSVLVRLGGAFAVMAFYLGSLAFFHLLIERILG